MVKKSVKTKEKILNSAIKIFSKKGFYGSTTSEIASNAGVAEGTIFRYFPKKSDLLHSAVLKGVKLLGQTVAVNSLKRVVERNEDEDIETLLREVVKDRINLLENHFSLFKIIFYEMMYHEDVRELFKDNISNLFSDIGKKILHKRKEKGELKDIDDIIISRSILGIVITTFMQRRFIPQLQTDKSMDEEIDIVIDIVLNGLRSDKND